jgi:hypothetical protein
MEIKLAFGAMSDPIEKQLNEQGLTLGMAAPKFERAADCIVYLRIHGYLTDSASDKARKKLMKEIIKAAKGEK